MQNQKIFFAFAVLFTGAILYSKWIEFNAPKQENLVSAAPQESSSTVSPANAIPSAKSIPSNIPSNTKLQENSNITHTEHGEIVSVETDLLKVQINTVGGVIESVEIKNEPVSLDKPNQGYALLKNTKAEVFIAQDGFRAGQQDTAPNHQNSIYKVEKTQYKLNGAKELKVPLQWISTGGIAFTKTFVFHPDSYVIEINYDIVNHSNATWQGYLYGQFSRSQPIEKQGGLMQMPSYTGPVIYTDAEKYQKIDFEDVAEAPSRVPTNNGWAAMIQHYFAAVWLPNEGSKELFTNIDKSTYPQQYQVGFIEQNPITLDPGQKESIQNKVYIGSKEHSQLNKVENEYNAKNLALTVDYGMLTFIAEPLFTVLKWIHKYVQNWGWSIIVLTLLIKLLFYPLSAKSYKSMAGMRKLQPRLETLKERYKDDRQKLQMEMMALYKKEKINPMGGCFPILIQMPVFIALYWVLLESVEIRHAPFMLWLNDLSAPDPYYVLPILMGVTMWLQQKMNPAPMDDMQKKIMMIMPIALTFLFLTFPQGLVLYWVVNNILTIVQQWFIYRKYNV